MKNEIVELRKVMRDAGVDVYYVPSGDFHNSEYVNEYFRVRAYLSGMTGSAGELLVTMDGAWLWTDGRYFLQAERQLAGTGIELMKMREPGVPTVREFLAKLVKDHIEKDPDSKYVIGFDGRVVPVSFGSSLDELCAENGGLAEVKWDEDLADRIWTDRPQIVPSKIWELPLSSAGVSASDKIAAVRKEMAAAGADHLLITDLMESAWLFNLRASDVLYTPVFFAFTLLTQDSVRLYLMDGAAPEGLPETLSFVDVRPYGDIYKDVAALPAGDKIWFDAGSANYALCLSIPEGVEKHEALTPVAEMKAVKNGSEIASERNAHIKDGAALTKFIKWIKDEAASGKQTELSADAYLGDRRLEQEGCFDLSFNSIIGYGPNGAIVHYAATPESDTVIKPEGFLLVDSGGQYIDGTTDVTRTLSVGPLTKEERDDYTLVLKSHVDVSMFRIEPGMTGADVDAAARKPLREAGLDFNHGLSHGVGHVLSVHEGPYRIGIDASSVILKPGLIMSNEPGVYMEGRFGVRIENMILFREAEDGCIVNEPLTCVPYDRDAINTELLSDEELAWINDYHKWVRDTLTPLLDKDTAAFLAKETAPLTR